MLLFVASAIIQIVEQMPFHRSVYLVATTLSTVGYGDVVATSFMGRAAILGMIALGIVLIPVQAAAFYAELNARRVVRGSLPDWRGKPFVLLSTRLTEVRAFSDFFAEFQQALGASSRFPRATKLMALCNRPSFEFSAFQELHDRSVTLVEGSAVSGQDLVTVKAERALAVLLIADRFTTDPEAEDLGILFQVWACKSYTKSVPLFVQTLRQSTVRQVAPFLDLGQDVIVSTEETRFRMLALSAVCPGASTLIGNLMRSSDVLPKDAQDSTLAGRKWMRQYVNGTEYSFCTAAVQRHLAGISFADVAEWLFRSAGFVVAGVIEPGGRVRLNPGRESLRMGTQLLVIGTDKKKVRKQLAEEFVPLSENIRNKALEAAAAAERRQMEAEGIWSSIDGNDSNIFGDICVPVVWGNFESDSVDPDSVPCVPSRVAEGLRSERDVKAFIQTYQKDPEAQREQANRGKLDETRARKMAKAAGVGQEEGTSASNAAAAAASGMLSSKNVVDSNASGSGTTTRDGTAAAGTTKDATAAESRTPQQARTTKQDSSTRDNASKTSKNSSKSSSQGRPPFSDHFILCGHGGSVVPFMRFLRTAEPSTAATIVVLAPTPPPDFVQARSKYGPVVFVPGSPAEASSLRAAGAATAKALVYLARGSRPVKTAQATGAAVERSTREAVLADANALLACYGVGEESGASLTHAVVELLFTTSIEFLQPGLLLKGISSIFETDEDGAPGSRGMPRKSWTMRALQQREAVAEGLAEWQANPYYAAGRVTVPALMDTFATQCFFSKGLLVEVLAELCGDLDRDGGARLGLEETSPGALLRLVPLPRGFSGMTYGDLFMSWAVGRSTVVAVGLYRQKIENPGTRLSYVVANPPAYERLEVTDRVFVLVERPKEGP